MTGAGVARTHRTVTSSRAMTDTAADAAARRDALVERLFLGAPRVIVGDLGVVMGLGFCA